MSRLDLLKKRRKKIIEIAEKRGGYNLRVFGSVARGEDTKESDIDFLMSFTPDTTLFDQGGLLMDLREYLNCKVDIVSDKAIHPLIRDEVLRSAVAL